MDDETRHDNGSGKDTTEESIDQEELLEDEDAPGSPPDDIPTTIDPENQLTDRDIDSDELYQEGLDAAAGAVDGTREDPQ